MAEQNELMELTIRRPDEALFERSKQMLEAAKDYKIATPEQATAAGEDLKQVKALAKEVEQKRVAITGPVNKALREVNALFRPAKDWLAEAERILKSALLSYQREQDRIAREAQMKAEEEARREREKLERKAKIARVIGREEKAEELHEEAEAQIAPKVESAAPEIAGISTREIWKAELTDKATFLRFVLDKRPDLLSLISVDQSALNAQARSLKDSLDIPGVKAVKDTVVAARS